MVSNNTLAGLIVALIVVSLVGTLSVIKPLAVITGFAAGDVTTSIGTDITITLPNNTIDFGNITQGTVNDTLDNKPWPFDVQNDGSVRVNITISATDLWSTTANPTANYMFVANKTGEGGAGWCFDGNASASNVTLTNMPPSTGKLLGLLESNNNCDTGEIGIKITAPADEPAGGKTSTVTVTASAG